MDTIIIWQMKQRRKLLGVGWNRFGQIEFDEINESKESPVLVQTMDFSTIIMMENGNIECVGYEIEQLSWISSELYRKNEISNRCIYEIQNDHHFDNFSISESSVVLFSSAYPGVYIIKEDREDSMVCKNNETQFIRVKSGKSFHFLESKSEEFHGKRDLWVYGEGKYGELGLGENITSTGQELMKLEFGDFELVDFCVSFHSYFLLVNELKKSSQELMVGGLVSYLVNVPDNDVRGCIWSPTSNLINISHLMEGGEFIKFFIF